jgi:hypothetical protein
MKVDMKDINLGLFAMGLEHFIIARAENIVDNGYKTRWKEEEYYTILVEKLPTKVSGKQTA